MAARSRSFCFTASSKLRMVRVVLMPALYALLALLSMGEMANIDHHSSD